MLASFSDSWGVLGCLGAASWAVLGRFVGVLRRLGSSWAVFGAVLGYLGPSWRRLGAILGRLGALLGVS